MNNTTIITGFHDPNRERKFNADLQGMKDTARKDGGYLGRADRPGLAETSHEPYTGKIKSRACEIRAEQMSSLQPEANARNFHIATLEKDQQIQKRQDEIDTLRHATTLDERDLEGKARPKKQKPTPFILGILILCYVAEVIFNASAFEFLNYGLLFALLIGAGVAGTCYGLARQAMIYSHKAKTEGKRISPGALLCVGTGFIIILCMAVLRSHLITSTEATINPWVFFGINIGLFAGTVFLTQQYAPKEPDADRILRERFDAIDRRTAEIKRLQAEIDALTQAHRAEEEKYIYIMSEAQHIDERIRTGYREALELFKTENLINRKDRGTPASFHTHTPDIIFPPHH